ncbi:MAG: AMP-binding protein [Alphaproteobacteria bacterium]|nr:AMP-binding protein [Alphaproteobacteria bacterium]
MKPSIDEILAGLPPRLHDMPARWAAERPDDDALIEGDTRWSWARFAQEIEAAAKALESLGVRPGHRVMIVIENGLAAAALLFAASRCGAWAVPVNARQKADEIDGIRDKCGPVRVLYTVGVSPEAKAHAARHGAEKFAWRGAGAVEAGPLAGDDLGYEAEPVTGDPAQDTAILLYTTGTTGRSKGVMLSHRSAVYVAAGPGSPAGLTAEDFSYAVLPLSHSFGLGSTFLRAVFHGSLILLEPRFSPERLLAALKAGITICNGVPAMYARLFEYLDKTGKRIEAPALRAVTAGGAPLDPALAARIEQAFGMGLINGYGLTEAAATVSRSAPGDAASAGRPLIGVEIRIVASDTSAVAPGETGELWVRGPNIMRGYYRDAEATRAALTDDGWLRTGDLGRLAEDGRIFVVDRAKEIIIHSGFNVSPVEVEEVLNAHPEIVQSAVLGVPLDGDEMVVAFVEPIEGSAITEPELLAFARERLASYKRPARVGLMRALPAAPTGKILKGVLRKPAAALLTENAP